MDPNQPELTLSQKQDAYKRELLRKSLDRCKVLNPTSQDFIVLWDKFPHLVPANGEAVFPRYIANKYMREMTDKILTFRSDENVRMENERRVKKGMKPMDKVDEQFVFESNFAINKPDLRKPVLESLWGGIIEPYGLDLVAEGTQNIAPTSDTDLLAEIEKENTTQATEPMLGGETNG